MLPDGTGERLRADWAVPSLVFCRVLWREASWRLQESAITCADGDFLSVLCRPLRVFVLVGPTLLGLPATGGDGLHLPPLRLSHCPRLLLRAIVRLSKSRCKAHCVLMYRPSRTLPHHPESQMSIYRCCGAQCRCRGETFLQDERWWKRLLS